MSHRTLPRLLGGLLFVASTPGLALAQMEPKGFYVTIYGQSSQIGASNFTESGALGAGTGLRADFGRGVGVGGDIGYRYGNGWAAEVEWNYRRHPLDGLTQNGATLARDGDFASNTLLINGLRRIKMNDTWTPYLGGGVGWVQEIDIDLTPGSGGIERGYSASNRFAVQLIAGVEYALTPRWRLSADVRWLRVGSVRLDHEEGNPGGRAGPLRYNPVSAQIGVRYSF